MEIEEDSFEVLTKKRLTQQQDNEQQLNEFLQIYCFFFYYKDQLGIIPPSLEQLKQVFYQQERVRNKNLEYFIVQIIKSFMKIMFSGDNKKKAYKMAQSKPQTSLLLFSSNIRIMFKDVSLLLVWPQVLSEILEIFNFDCDRIEQEQIRNCTPAMFNSLSSEFKFRIFKFFIDTLQNNLKLDFSPESFEKKESKIEKKIEELKEENSASNKAEIEILQRSLFFLVRPFVCIGVNDQEQNVWILDSEPTKLFIQIENDIWKTQDIYQEISGKQLNKEIKQLKKEKILKETENTQKNRGKVQNKEVQDLVIELQNTEFSDSHLDQYYQKVFNFMLQNYEIYHKDPIEFIKNFLLDIYESYTNYINLIGGYFGPSQDFGQEVLKNIKEISDLQDAKKRLIEIDQNFSKVFVKGDDNKYEKYSFTYWHYYILGLKSRFRSYLNKVHLPYQLLVLTLTFYVVLIQLVARKHKYFDQEVEEKEKQEEYYTCKQCSSTVDTNQEHICKICKKVFHLECLPRDQQSRRKPLCRTCKVKLVLIFFIFFGNRKNIQVIEQNLHLQMGLLAKIKRLFTFNKK